LAAARISLLAAAENKTMNAELIQYLAQFMPLAPIQCDGCTREVEISKAIEREGKFFHSEKCADIALAPMVKPQNKGTQFEGWMI